MAIKIKAMTVGPIESNCYVVWDDVTKHGVIVDPGGDYQRILQAVEEAECQIDWVLLTHGHFDHVFYAGPVAKHFGAKTAIHAADITLIGDTLELAEIYYDINEYEPLYPDHLLEDGQVLKVDGFDIEVIHTPGHSLGGTCFLILDSVFTGDTLFKGSIGRTDFPGGSMEEISNSIRNKLYKLDDQVVVYPGHGEISTIGQEKRTNPFVQGVI